MLTEDKLREMLGQCESEALDFKREPHALNTPDEISKFIKDIICMANTPRQEAAYIVAGVDQHTDGSKSYTGVTHHPDDADLQQRLNRAAVTPKPRFSYQTLHVDGISYGIIEIPVDTNGPFYAMRDLGVLKAHRLYFRRGTMNDEATSEERKNIYRWFLGEPKKAEEMPPFSERVLNWEEFHQACHHFDQERLYLLVLGPHELRPEAAWRYLARLPISLVLDFDPETAQQGIYSVVAPEMQSSRSVHLWTLGNEDSMVPEKACYWYAARGLEGRALSMVEEEWRSWNRKYGRALTHLVEQLARASGGRPLTLLSLWYAPQYLREVCTIVDRTFGDAADYVFAVSDSARLEQLAKQFGGHAVSIRIEDILHGIARNMPSTESEHELFVGIPNSDGGFAILERAEVAWLSEDMEVLHSNVELESGRERRVGIDYLMGATIDCADLAGHYDAERNEISQLQRLIQADLESRTVTRLNLYHWPGAGGTTVARRVAWNLRRSYPTVLLKRIAQGETIGRFRKLFAASNQPVLAVVEAGDNIPDRLEQLYSEARTENIPVVFLTVIRRFETPSQNRQTGTPQRSKRTLFLGQSLDLSESRRFADAYARVAPQKEPLLEGLLNKGAKERTPFEFALTAFGRDYQGLTRYVESRLEIATSKQREILTYLALSHYYGHKALRAQILAAYLGLPESRPVRLQTVLDEPQLELLVQEGDGKWRPRHQVISEEMLKIVLSGDASERRNWKQNLSTWSHSFIDICARGSLTPSDDLLDLLRRVFILRDEHELLGTESSATSKFARLIEDIPTYEGRLSVLKALVEAFPEEAHFWGHLGRFYSNPMKEPAEAIKAIEQAIRLAPEDPVLHHMQGMCYRQVAYEKMGLVRDQPPTREQMREIQETVDTALEVFAKARELEPDSEHAHISPIQMLIRTLDFGFRMSRCKSRAEFLGQPTASWYREQLDKAENLLEETKSIRENEKPSGYMLDCQARLYRIYDDYGRALQDWNNLLNRTDVYAPPIRRQIARTYLARQGRDWSALEPREIQKVIDLMEDNLREEPSSEHNIRLWFRAIRYSPRQDIDLAMDRLAHWRTSGDSQDAYYYLYILHVLKAIEGSTIERIRSEELIEQSARKARNRRNRTFSFEWYGKGTGMSSLVHHSELGEWDEDTQFYPNTSRLVYVDGRIAKIKAPESGVIELSSCGLSVFFVPARAGAAKGRDENQWVKFNLGFSYDGLRAWNVHLEPPSGHHG